MRPVPGEGWPHGDPHHRRPLRRDRRPRPAQAAARPAAPLPDRADPRDPGRRDLARRPRPRLVRRVRPRRPSTEFGGDRRPDGLGRVRQPAALGAGRRRRRRRSAARSTRRRRTRGARSPRRLHYLSVPPKAALAVVHMLDARPGWSSAAGSSWRSRSAPTSRSAASSTPSCTRSSTRSRSSGSTTSSARRRPRTSWPSASPTGCSSRSGTATTSTTSRSTCPRRSGLAQRADFYEATGAYRDMVVTHLFQVLAFTAMEPPTALEPFAISEEKNKVFRSMPPIEPHDVVRGQYVGYRDIEGVAPESETETFVALKCFVDNWRWAGVPVLPAHRQAAGRGRPDHLDRVQGAAAVDVPARLGRRRPRPRPPDLRPRRPGQDVAVLLRQAPRPGHEARQAVDAVRHARDRLGRRGARGLRAAHLRRRPGRPHAVHLRRGHRAALGALGAAAREPARRAPLPAGLLGPQPDPPAGRALRPGGCRSSAAGATPTSSAPDGAPAEY